MKTKATDIGHFHLWKQFSREKDSFLNISSYGSLFLVSRFTKITSIALIIIILSQTLPADFSKTLQRPQDTNNSWRAFADNTDLTTLSNDKLLDRFTNDLNTINNLSNTVGYAVVVDVTNQAVSDLQNNVSTLITDDQLKTSLLNKLGTVQNQLNVADGFILSANVKGVNDMLNAVDNKLSDFINEIEAQEGKKVPNSVANQLITDAQNIITNSQKRGSDVISLLNTNLPLPITTQVRQLMDNTFAEFQIITSLLESRGFKIQASTTVQNNVDPAVIDIFDSAGHLILEQIVEAGIRAYWTNVALAQAGVQFIFSSSGWAKMLLVNTGLNLSVKTSEFDPNFQPQDKQFLIAITQFALGQVGFSKVLDALNLPAIRQFWIDTASLDPSGDALQKVNFIINNFLSSMISGTKFDGVSRNPIPNWTIAISNLLTAGSTTQATTDSMGHYKFDNLASGTYTVFEVQKPGFVQISPDLGPPTNGAYSVPIGAGTKISGKDFVNQLTPPFISSPTNGQTLTTNPTITGHALSLATVTVYEGSTPIGTKTADSAGNWSVTPSLSAGTHTITATETINGITSAQSKPVTFTFTPSTSQCITPPTGMVGWWPADGNTNDLIGGHTGTISGGVTFAPGKVAQAFSFDGTGLVGVGSLGISSDTQPFSEIAWINPSSSSINDGLLHTIVAEGSTPNNAGHFGEFMTHFSLIGSNGLGQLEIEIGATQTYSTQKNTLPVIKPGQWSLVAVTYDGSRTAAGIKVYVNGVEQLAIATLGSGFTGTAIPRDQWTIGSQTVPGGINLFSGLIDETEIFNTAVTQQVIQSEFNADSAGKCKPTTPGTIAGTIHVGNSPAGIGVNTQTNKIYVANQNDNTVSVIDATANTVVKTIAGLGNRPLLVDVNTQTNKIYVTNFNSNTVSVIDGTTDTVVSTVSVGTAPVGVGVNPTTNKIYVGNYNSGTVSVIDGATNNVVKTIPAQHGTSGVGVNAVTNKIYAVNAQPSGAPPGTVSVIDGTTDTIISTITVGGNPQLASVNPITNKIYVTNAGSNTISEIDGSTNAVVSTIPVAAGPGGAGINAATNKIYYSTASGMVQVIDGNTNAIVKTISVGGMPDLIGVNTNTNKIYVADLSSTTVTIINGL